MNQTTRLFHRLFDSQLLVVRYVFPHTPNPNGIIA